MSEQQPSVGRIVHCVDGDGVHRAAMIIAMNKEYVDLTVFESDGTTSFVRESFYDPRGELADSWHWPEYVAPKDTP